MRTISAAISGMGWVTPLGADLETVWTRARAGARPEPSVLTPPASGTPHSYLAVPPKLVDHLGRHPRLRRSSAISYYAVAAGLLALEDARVTLDVASAARTALVFAISDGAVIYTRKFYEQIVRQGANTASPLLFPETVYNAPGSHLAAMLGIDGASYTLVGDQSVGLAALAFAAQLLHLGEVDRVVVVGAEECDWILCEAYDTWRLARRPLAEGAAAVLLAREGGVRVETTLGEPFFRRREAGAALGRELGRLGGAAAADLVVASANGTFIDATEAAVLALLAPAAPVWRVKDSLGEAPGASALWQVIAAALAVRRGEARNALVPVLGFNQQAAGATLTPPSA